MLRKSVVVRNKNGLHIRVAAEVCREAAQHESAVTLCSGCKKANCCSVIEMLMLGASEGTELEITVCGNDEERAIAAVANIFRDGSGI